MKILFHDKNLIVINKPLGLITKNIIKNSFFKKNNILPNKGILNRLDKYTSGIILISKNIFFYFFFKKILQKKLVKKKYKAFTKIYKKNKGFINLSIYKKKKNFYKKK